MITFKKDNKLLDFVGKEPLVAIELVMLSSLHALAIMYLLDGRENFDPKKQKLNLNCEHTNFISSPILEAIDIDRIE